MKKYLAYYETEWPANIAELTAIENKPFVGYLKGEGVSYTVIPPPTPETWKIYYTSSDGSVVTPFKTNGFGANIVSNTYEAGQGVITFDGTVTSTGYETFFGCSSLTSITIPNSVESIGESAFENCSSLTSVTIPNNVTSIGDNAFYNCSKLTKTNYTGDIAEWCNISFGVPASNPMCHSHNFYINDQEIKDLVIPDSVTSIKSSTFYRCSSLTSITIPNSVTSIGDYAFCECSGLTSVTIPNSVTSIGRSAFYGCSKLTSVTIGESVTRIGNNAFDGCKSLNSITYEGTQEQWNAITKGYKWNYNVLATYVQCTDGRVTL